MKLNFSNIKEDMLYISNHPCFEIKEYIAMNSNISLGIDIGSTTVKIVIMNNKELLFSDYERHFANIQETLASLMRKAEEALGDLTIQPVITGSGGLTISKHLYVPFVQEVIAVATSLQDYAPHTDVAIELGGEDAKIIYFSNGVEQRDRKSVV